MKEWGISIEIPNDETIEAMQELENGGGIVFEGSAHDFISVSLEELLEREGLTYADL